MAPFVSAKNRMASTPAYPSMYAPMICLGNNRFSGTRPIVIVPDPDAMNSIVLTRPS
jgi:hypothetical protein